MNDEANVGRTIAPLTEDQVKLAVGSEIKDAIGYQIDQLAAERKRGLERYLARPFPFDSQISGRSTAKLDDVRDTVEWIMPALVRMFLGGSTTVRYTGRSPRGEMLAKVATDTVNQLFRSEWDGFTIMHDMIKTALIEKTGIAGVRAETRECRDIERYEGLSQEQLDMLLGEGMVQPLQIEQRMETVMMPVPQPGGGIAPVPTPMPFFDCRVMRMSAETRIVIEGVPPEEFLIHRRARDLNDETVFCGMRRRMTISDLLALGYDREKIMALPFDENLAQNDAYQVRRLAEQEIAYGGPNRSDVASRQVWVNDCYIRIDEDGDGYAELRRIVCAGDESVTILSDDYANTVDFCSVTPYRLPYKWAGLSVADLVYEIELIRSTILRQHLDNFYLRNNSRVLVVEGEVELDDLLNVHPGGIVRCHSSTDSVAPLAIEPLGPQAMELLEFMDRVREDRSGASRLNQGLDASALNDSTATGMLQLMSAAAARIELIARVFAETGFKRMFKLILRKLIETPNQRRQMKIAGEWMEVDPSTWDLDLDVSIEVGLGQGRAAERIMFLEKILGMQVQAMQGGLGMVDPAHLYHTAEGMVEAMGFPRADKFFKDPTLQPPPPPAEPEPKDKAALESVEVNKGKLYLDQQKHEEIIREHNLEDARGKEEIASRERTEMARIASQEQIALMQIRAQEQQSQAELEIKKLEIEKAKVDVEKAKVSATSAKDKATQQKAAGKKPAAKGGKK